MAEQDRLRWDARYAEATSGSPPGWLEALDDELPREGRALDVAAGTGRLAVWMATRGLDVTAVDISSVGLVVAQQAAEAAGVRIGTAVLDLERDRLPPGPFHLISCFHYRQPDLFAALRERLAPGGWLLAERATVHNLERHAKPSRRWLSEPNELLHEAEGLTMAYYREGWLGGRHLARLAATRSSSGSTSASEGSKRGET